MKLQNFTEWFAIRSNHQDDNHWPGQLRFDLEDGIYLTTARFINSANLHIDPTFQTPTITGWLDYQRPTTLIHPQIQEVRGLNLGMNTPALRASYQFVVNAVLKNVFLEDINAPIFTGLVVDHPAVHAWLAPELVNHKWLHKDGSLFPSLSVEVQPSRERSFTLSGGTEATVTSATRAPRETALTLDEYSILQLRFPEPVKYNEITRITWRISTLFSFLIGTRIGSPVYQLPTTHTRPWNGEDCEVVAELWYRPAGKTADSPPKIFDRLLVERRCSLALERILELVMGGRDELIYLANMIQAVEGNELPPTQGYIELVGCLEQFDASTFGSGKDPNFSKKMKNLARIIQDHGSDIDHKLFNRMRHGARNGYSLLYRLNRLHDYWRDAGFFHDPNLGRIRDLRNLLPHGYGLEVSSEVVQEMVEFSFYLTALGRYHTFRALGCTDDEIAKAFSSQPHRYGPFLPKHKSRENNEMT